MKNLIFLLHEIKTIFCHVGSNLQITAILHLQQAFPTTTKAIKNPIIEMIHIKKKKKEEKCYVVM